MPETYLAVAAAQWILLVRSSAVAEAVDGGVEGHDLAALFGGAVAAAWIRLDGGVATLGVSRVLGLVDLAPDDFALMPEGLAPSSMFDAVTLAPIESFAVPAVEPYSPPLEEGVSRVDAVGALFDPNAGVPVDRPLPPPSSAIPLASQAEPCGASAPTLKARGSALIGFDKGDLRRIKGAHALRLRLDRLGVLLG
jgi:hypothetical protein